MLKIRPLTQQDLSPADRIISAAFGTFLGAPEPQNFWADLAYARTRWPADQTAAFGAEWDGEIVGSNFATRWGSVGFFGPLTVRPDLWDRKIAQRLMVSVRTVEGHLYRTYVKLGVRSRDELDSALPK